MFRDLIVNALCLVSIVGVSAATALSLDGERPDRFDAPKVAVSVDSDREVVAIKPEQLTAWSTAIANAVPVIAASLLLVWSNYRATKRRIEAEDAAVAKNPHLAEQEREAIRIEAAQAKDSPPPTSRSKDQEGRQDGRL